MVTRSVSWAFHWWCCGNGGVVGSRVCDIEWICCCLVVEWVIDYYMDGVGRMDGQVQVCSHFDDEGW